MKQLSKAEEIDLLTKLANGGGYFADSFGKDLPVMIENIRNDYDITSGISLISDINALTRKIDLLEIQYEKEKARREAEFLAKQMDYYSLILKRAPQLTDWLVSEIGLDQVIKLKRSSQIELSSEEIDYLISKI